jgi:DNA-binding transcriptional ArsR family regulator
MDPIVAISGKPPIRERPLLSHGQAGEVVELFKVLANESRLRMLHAVARDGELCVGDLAAAVGMTPQAASNQLRRLADRRIVAPRRDGNRIYYRIVDPCVPGLLGLGVCLAEEVRAGGDRGEAAARIAEDGRSRPDASRLQEDCCTQ